MFDCVFSIICPDIMVLLLRDLNVGSGFHSMYLCLIMSVSLYDILDDVNTVNTTGEDTELLT